MTFARLVYSTCWLALMMLCFAVAAMAQTETATISGLITDDTGAVVAGTEVKLQSVDRGTAQTATTNNAGIYVFASVHPGPYQLTVHKLGFRQVDFLGLIVNVQDHIEQNFHLQVGSLSESVTVEASAATINTQDATVSTVVDRQFAENLPMNGRSFQTLIQLTPGVVVVPTNIVDEGQFSVNGQRAASNYWMVDGVSANIGIGASGQGSGGNGMGGTLGSFSALGGTNSLVSIDAMQEFRIQTSTYAPEFGRTPGGQISILTRSGTNQFHGTAFEYVRNDVFDANDWFADDLGLAKPEERQNDFGGTFSGPILKDRTFFFFSYEGLRLRLPQVVQGSVPDLNARQTAIPQMQPFLNAYPIQSPNLPDDPSTGVAGIAASYSNAANLDAYSLRIDHKLSDRLTLFGRYNYSPSEIIQRGGDVLALSVVTPIHITVQTGTLGATWAISPQVANDLRFNYSHTSASSFSFLDNFGGASPLASLPFPSPFTSQNALFFFEIRSPQFLFGGQLADGPTNKNLQRQINIVDNLSVQQGSHSLKFGIDFRRLSPITTPEQYQQQVFFSSVGTAATGNASFADTFSLTGATLLFRNLGVFAQDTWRVSPRLTLTYGLRWDLDFSPSTLSGPSIPAVTGFNLNNFSQLAIAPGGTSPFRTTFGNVAPRIGLAYQLTKNQNWETVLRGGFGVFYDLASSETGGLINALPPFGQFNIIVGATFPLSPTDSAPPVIPSTGTIAFPLAINPNLKLPYTLEWNVALEQALGKQQTLSVSYVGAAGRRLLQTTSVSFPPSNPNIEDGTFLDNSATSDYDALQVQFQRRLSRGLQALASYTWAHSIDTGSAGSNQLQSNANTPGASNSNRGPSDFDIRNAFSAGVTYDIPGSKKNTLAKVILSGWSVQNIIQARSAPPVDIQDTNFFGAPFDTGISADLRPDIVPGQPFYLFGAQCASTFQALGTLLPGHSCPGGKGINPAAFTDPPADPLTGNPLRQGTLGRNALRGFGAWQWDFAMHRTFPIRESLKLQFRAEIFNLLNHPNFGPPNGQFGETGFFGVSTQTLGQSLAGANTLGSGGFDPLYQIGGPRSVQFALKLMF